MMNLAENSADRIPLLLNKWTRRRGIVVVLEFFSSHLKWFLPRGTRKLSYSIIYSWANLYILGHHSPYSEVWEAHSCPLWPVWSQ